jgi:hypothetical protein
MNEQLNKLYTNPINPGSFSGFSNFQRLLKHKNVKATKKQIKQFLQKKESYSLHMPRRKNFRRKRVIVGGINDTFQIDLVDMTTYEKENDGFKFILTCIDVFSKKAHAMSLKNKNQNSTTDAMEKILKNSIPKRIQADKGSEFFNIKFKKLLKDNKIVLYATNSDLKAQTVERFNRTIKDKMWRIFTEKGNHRWIDILPKLIKSYNNSYHRSIKRTPNQVKLKDESEIFLELYKYKKEDGDSSTIKINFQIGEFVRISNIKGIFDKGYFANFTREIFVIEKIVATNPPSYHIQDLNGEEIKGSFYEKELQKVKDLDENFEIDKILETKRINNQKYFLVSWLGYPSSFNSWVPQSKIYKK